MYAGPSAANIMVPMVEDGLFGVIRVPSPTPPTPPIIEAAVISLIKLSIILSIG